MTCLRLVGPPTGPAARAGDGGLRRCQGAAARWPAPRRRRDGDRAQARVPGVENASVIKASPRGALLSPLGARLVMDGPDVKAACYQAPNRRPRGRLRWTPRAIRTCSSFVEETETTTLDVDAMSCASCVDRRVERALADPALPPGKVRRPAPRAEEPPIPGRTSRTRPCRTPTRSPCASRASPAPPAWGAPSARWRRAGRRERVREPRHRLGARRDGRLHPNRRPRGRAGRRGLSGRDRDHDARRRPCPAPPAWAAWSARWPPRPGRGGRGTGRRARGGCSGGGRGGLPRTGPGPRGAPRGRGPLRRRGARDARPGADCRGAHAAGLRHGDGRARRPGAAPRDRGRRGPARRLGRAARADDAGDGLAREGLLRPRHPRAPEGRARHEQPRGTGHAGGLGLLDGGARRPWAAARGDGRGLLRGGSGHRDVDPDGPLDGGTRQGPHRRGDPGAARPARRHRPCRARRRGRDAARGGGPPGDARPRPAGRDRGGGRPRGRGRILGGRVDADRRADPGREGAGRGGHGRHGQRGGCARLRGHRGGRGHGAGAHRAHGRGGAGRAAADPRTRQPRHRLVRARGAGDSQP